MKKLFCYLLIVWLALVSGGANAWTAVDAAHEAEHATHVHAANIDAASTTGADHNDADHAEACQHSHCGHGHTTGLLRQVSASNKIDVTRAQTATSSCWASAAIANNIERPKWNITTPAVVNLLA